MFTRQFIRSCSKSMFMNGGCGISLIRPITTTTKAAQDNTKNFSIIESTLREGEQYADAFFNTQHKIDIARMLDEFGVEYIELTSPAASPESRRDATVLAGLGLQSKLLTHVRCNMEDAKIAIETGVSGLDIVFGTSSHLREFSHGKDIRYIIDSACEVIRYTQQHGVEARFSSEDSFRSELVDLLNIYSAAAAIGVDRVGIADTGLADPRQVFELVKILRGVVSCDIEFHGHNDTGCAIANAYAALQAGATHIDTSILGIGERNGIAPIGGFLARMYVSEPEYIKSKYNLPMLKELENYIARRVKISIPFNNYVTGSCAFTHKAGIHAKAMLNNPSTYEVIKPSDFGVTRSIPIGHRLTGWNAVKNRCEQLGLGLSDADIKDLTSQIKQLADSSVNGIADVDSLLLQFASAHTTLHLSKPVPLLKHVAQDAIAPHTHAAIKQPSVLGGHAARQADKHPEFSPVSRISQSVLSSIAL